MSLLPLISKLSIDGRSRTAITSVLPSRRSSTSRKKPVAYSARSDSSTFWWVTRSPRLTGR